MDMFPWASCGTKHFAIVSHLIFKAVLYANEESSAKSLCNMDGRASTEIFTHVELASGPMNFK